MPSSVTARRVTAPRPRRPGRPCRRPSGQLAVARSVAAGKSNREVARDLYISVKTVEFHVSQILTRLAVDSRGEIAAALTAAARTQG
jgi:DNA-binding NarL/FixJ family response regulator